MEGGRWGLVIIFSAFMIQFLTFGTTFAMGVYTVEFLDYFGDDTFAVSFILSINIGIFLGSGPVMSYLMTRFTHRSIVLVGGLMSSVGIIMIPVLPYLPAIYIFYGLVNGLGCCMAYTPSHVLSGLYYDKYQSLSTGVATSGSGLGSAVMPILVGYLIEEFTWKGSLYIIGGLNLNMLVFGALLRPPPPKHNKNVLLEDKEEVEAIEKAETKTQDLLETKTQDLLRSEVVDCPDESKKMLKDSDGKRDSITVEPKSLLRRICKEHFYVFRNFAFVVYCINNVGWNFTCGVLVTFVPDYLVLKGLDRIDAAFIATVAGFGTFVGGVIGAILGNVAIINRLALFVISNVLYGLSCFLFVWLSGYTSYFLNGLLSGFSLGITLALLLVLVADFLGVENLGHGLGYLLLCNGIGAFSGPPVAGYLQQISGSYEPGLFTAGIVSIVSGVLMILIPCQKACYKNKDVQIKKEIDI